MHSFKGDRRTPDENGWVSSLFPVSGNSVIHGLLVKLSFPWIDSSSSRGLDDDTVRGDNYVSSNGAADWP